MLTMTQAAAEYARAKKQPIYLEMSPIIEISFTIRESPSVHFGHPRNPEQYEIREIEGITVYVPYELPEQPLMIHLNRFLGFRKLVIEGWHLA